MRLGRWQGTRKAKVQGLGNAVRCIEVGGMTCGMLGFLTDKCMSRCHERKADAHDRKAEEYNMTSVPTADIEFQNCPTELCFFLTEYEIRKQNCDRVRSRLQGAF